MKRKRFEELLLKNTLALVIPALVIFVILFVFIIRYPVLAKMKIVPIDTTEKNLSIDLDNLYVSGTTNVECEIKNLKYTGFDYYKNTRMAGAYYYTFDNDDVHMYIIKTDNPEPTIDKIKIKGKILKDSVNVEHILNQFSKVMNVDENMLLEFASPYVVSEVDYPRHFVALVYGVVWVPILICILIISYTFLIWRNPKLHPQAKQLIEYGDIGEVINELDIQLRSKLLYRKNNIYITEDYMIVNYLTRTDVIKLDYIKYMSKNLIEDYDRAHARGALYRITMSNPQKLFYEVDLPSEELADTVVEYILGKDKKE